MLERTIKKAKIIFEKKTNTVQKIRIGAEEMKNTEKDHKRLGSK